MDDWDDRRGDWWATPGPMRDMAAWGEKPPPGWQRPDVAPSTAPTPSGPPGPSGADAGLHTTEPEAEIDDDTALRLLATWLRRLAAKL